MNVSRNLAREHDSDQALQQVAFNEELGRRLAALARGEHVDPDESRARLRRKSELLRETRD